MVRRIALAFLASLALAGVAVAQPAPPRLGTISIQSAETTIRNGITTNTPPAQVLASLKPLIDFDRLGKAAMGSYWWRLQHSQRNTFVNLLGDLIEAQLRQLQRTNHQFTIHYLGETTNPAGHIVVTTELRTQSNNRPLTLAIDFVIDAKGTAPHLVELVVNGTGLVANYQRMFAKIIGERDFGALIEKMQQKLAGIP